MQQYHKGFTNLDSSGTFQPVTFLKKLEVSISFSTFSYKVTFTKFTTVDIFYSKCPKIPGRIKDCCSYLENALCYYT